MPTQKLGMDRPREAMPLTSTSSGESLVWALRMPSGIATRMEHSSETADALCRAFCRAFHYEGLTFTLEGTDGSAAAVQSFDGAPVVNCSVTFSISGGSVVSVSGTHLPPEGQASGSGNALSALAALNEVLSTIRSGAVVGMLWGGLALLAGFAAVLTVVIRRRKEN